jgi:hypothetical protein
MNDNISDYPQFSEISLEQRMTLHPFFQSLGEGISEFTFANIYLFRDAHFYRISRLGKGLYIITGIDGGNKFFMLPFGIPERGILMDIFHSFTYMKAVSESQASQLDSMGYRVSEDRDNFDYLYLKNELEGLQGRKFHKKKNLVNAFINNYSYEGRPLIEEYLDDALEVLEEWRRKRQNSGDYKAAREAVERSEELVLCGGIYYVDGKPAAFTLGEEIARGTTYVIHFEKAVGNYKGLYQFINMSFASILPEKYIFINSEQDLGEEGLRHAKLSYRPHTFVKKYRAYLQ